MTAGISDSVNECFSRRKWTSTTLSSAAKNASARTGHGMPIGGTGTGWWTRKPKNRSPASPASRAVNDHTRSGTTQRATARAS